MRPPSASGCRSGVNWVVGQIHHRHGSLKREKIERKRWVSGILSSLCGQLAVIIGCLPRNLPLQHSSSVDFSGKVRCSGPSSCGERDKCISFEERQIDQEANLRVHECTMQTNNDNQNSARRGGTIARHKDRLRLPIVGSSNASYRLLLPISMIRIRYAISWLAEIDCKGFCVECFFAY